MNSLLVFLGKSAKSESKIPSVPSLHPLRGHSRFRGGAKARITFQTRHGGAKKPAQPYSTSCVYIFCSSGKLEQVLHFWGTFCQNIGYGTPVKPEKASSLIKNVKYDWTTPVKAPLMTRAGGRGSVGTGNSEIEQRGPSSEHTACLLVVRFPWQ